MTTSPTLSAERPPSDPVALRDWIAAREEAFARLTRTTLRRIVGRAGDAFTRSLDAGAGDLAAFDGIPMQWAEAVRTELMPELLDLYRAGALAALITAGGEPLLAVGISSAGPTALGDWDSIVNYDALAYQATATNRLVGVGDTIWSDVRQRTVTGLEAGWTNERMKDEIEGLGQFSEYRADTIARTEANAAYNGGNYDAADALGEYGPVAKTWSAFIDRRTRPSHAQANEQTVAFAEPFIVGGTPMDRPHDPLAPAEEVVNCRCRVLFLFDGDTDSTGRVWTRQRPQASTTVERSEPMAEQPRADLTAETIGEVREGSLEPIPGQDAYRARLSETETNALRTYTGNTYEEINEALRRAQSTGSLPDLTPDQSALVEAIDSAIAKADEVDPFLLYRGQTVPAPNLPGGTPYSMLSPDEQIAALADAIEQAYPTGRRFDFGGGFVSTSTDVAAPIDASLSRSTRGVIFEIEARRGAPLSGISRYEDETEVLLARDAQFEVVRVERDVEFYDFTYDRTVRRTVVVIRQVA